MRVAGTPIAQVESRGVLRTRTDRELVSGHIVILAARTAVNGQLLLAQAAATIRRWP